MNSKKILIIVPHPDDELSIGGGLIPRLKKKGYIIKVLIVTNGDADTIGKIRLKESLKGLRILGVMKKDIIFLGYGNRWQGNSHIYNTEKNSVISSLAGRDKTYALKNHVEFHYEKYLKHESYTRENMLKDMRECISDTDADIIICVDFDSHPDHRAVSLMFEECMAYLLDKTDYRPIVLKRFAYAFAWHGDNTSYSRKIGRYQVFDNRFQLDNPYYDWQARIVCRLPKSRQYDLKLFLASLAYPSQNAIIHLKQLLKEEMIFWNRRTDNLIFGAKVLVSSGQKEFLSDFKRFDCADVNKKSATDKFWEECAWHPLYEDNEKAINIIWEREVYISYIVIYPSLTSESKILDCEIIINHETYNTGHLRCDKEKRIYINNKTKKATIRINKYEGKNPGISEVEAYSTKELDKLNNFIKEIES
jgi:LmbE family N-acetylglucosaminyl deacetylase